MFNLERFKKEYMQSDLSMADVDRNIGANGQGLTSKYVNGVRSPHPPLLYKFLVAFGWNEEKIQRELLTDWYTID